MKNYILDKFNEYNALLNIKWSNVPQIKPIFDNTLIDSEDGIQPILYVPYDTIHNNIVEINYGNVFVNLQEIKRKSLLFHEFTHITDADILFNRYPEKDELALLHTYSEYHASQIEIQTLLNFPQNRIKTDNLLFPGHNEMISFERLFIDPLSSAVVELDHTVEEYSKLTDIEFYLRFRKFLDNTMYYLGKFNYCKSISLHRIPDITYENFEEFSPIVRSMENSIKQKKFDVLIRHYYRFKDKFYAKYTRRQ